MASNWQIVCRQGDRARAIALIQGGHPIDLADEHGMTPMAYAVHNGCAPIVRLLKALGANTKIGGIRSEFSLSSPHVACGISALMSPISEEEKAQYRQEVYFESSMVFRLLNA